MSEYSQVCISLMAVQIHPMYSFPNDTLAFMVALSRELLGSVEKAVADVHQGAATVMLDEVVTAFEGVVDSRVDDRALPRSHCSVASSHSVLWYAVWHCVAPWHGVRRMAF